MNGSRCKIVSTISAILTDGCVKQAYQAQAAGRRSLVTNWDQSSRGSRGFEVPHLLPVDELRFAPADTVTAENAAQEHTEVAGAAE